MAPIILTALNVLVATFAVLVAYRVLVHQSAPSVLVFASVDRNRPTVLNIEVKNFGATAAENLSLHSSKPIQRCYGVTQLNSISELQDGIFTHGAPMLHPGEKRTITWGQYHALVEHYGDTPITIEAKFKYKRPLSLWNRFTTQESEIRLGSFASDDISDIPLLRIAKSLEKIADRMK